MPVKVQFPDGTEREMPSYTVEIANREIPVAPSSFVQKPIPDRDWSFTPLIGGRWIASPKRSA